MRAVLRRGGRLALESLSVAETWLPGGVRRARDGYAFGGVRMRVVNRYDAAESRVESEVAFTDEDGRVEHARSRTGSTRPARSCGCCARPGSPTWR